MSEHLSFGPYRFEPQTARLWNGKREIRVTRKAAGVLGVLVAHAGQPVSKQELFASVWRDTIVSDDALVSCVQELRKALGDDARRPRFIETRHRSGYRFVASVTPPGNAPRAATAVRAQDAAAIAVLPFTNLSPERDQDYFCEGLADELIDALSHVEGLRVAARSCAFQFRGIGIDVREVGRRLGVGSLLEGSVRRDGARLRVTVQLVDVASGFHRWSQRFEKPLGDVFAIQDEIAESVATNLRGSALSGHERHALQRPHTATEAYNFYLRGRQHLHRMRRPDLAQSRRMFERAIELDAGYAPAWAGLATVHATVFEWWGAQGEDLRRAEEASVVAMQASPELADAHVARGLALSLRREYDQAQLHFEAAARINPNLFDAYYYHARTCFERGDVPRSADLFHKAAQVRARGFPEPVAPGAVPAHAGADRGGARRGTRVCGTRATRP